MSPYLIHDPFFTISVPISKPEVKSSDPAFVCCAWQGDVEACKTVSVSCVVWNSLPQNSDSLGCSHCKKGDCISFILAQPHFLFRIAYPVRPSVTPPVFCHALGGPKGKHQWSKLLCVTSGVLALANVCFSKLMFNRGNKSFNCFPHVCCSTANLLLNWPGRLQQTLYTGEVKRGPNIMAGENLFLYWQKQLFLPKSNASTMESPQNTVYCVALRF